MAEWLEALDCVEQAVWREELEEDFTIPLPL